MRSKVDMKTRKNDETIKMITEDKGRKKRKARTLEVIHPIFDECAKAVNDDYWRDIFSDASKGVFPRAFSYINNYLVYRYGNQKIRMEVPENIREAISACRSFFQEHGAIYSEDEIENAGINYSNETEKMEWKKIKSNKIRKFLINCYIDTLISQYQLSVNEQKNLRTLVHLALLRSEIDKTHIEDENGIIVNIRGLKYDDVTHQFYLDPTIIKQKKIQFEPYHSPPDVDEIEFSNINSKISFSKNWTKFLTNLKKNCQKSTKPKIRIVNNLSPTPTSHISESSDDLLTT